MRNKNIDYFKLQAKNLFHDIKLDFMQNDEEYICAPRFFDVNAVMSDFDVDCNDFSLMKAQHLLAKIVGFSSWDELINASESELEQKKDVLNTIGYKLQRQKIYHIDLSGYEKIAEGKGGDYVLKCPRLPELVEIAQMEPNAYFQSCEDIEELYNDTEHFYVNVCPKWSQIRVKVPGKKWPDWYAVVVRNIGKM